ncbi:MAG TPA: Gfo/Idh/MocA family oxidoreductase [Symbiobacteriaceae bacterium]|nr:Gfo/Idh/MocA family oxidoreductase [Symbiobacteriaceae bacterium]
MKKVNIAVVGLGSIARTHIASLRALPAVRPLAVQPVLHTLVTRRPAEVAAEAIAMGFAAVTDSLEGALSGTDVDVVDICTPNALHREAAMAALARGKAVYCEKPLASNLADAEAMAAAAAAASTVTQVALVYRYHPVAMRLKALLEMGAIGQLLQFRATYNHSGYLNPTANKGWRSRSELSGGGGLLDLGVHVVDLLQLLAGPLRLEHADTRTLVRHRLPGAGAPPQEVDVDDWALLHVVTHAGVPGTVETSRIALGSECFRLEFYGTGGSVVCDLGRDAEPQVRRFAPEPLPVPGHPALQYLPPSRLTLGPFVDAHQAGLYHFLLRFVGEDPTPGWAPDFTAALTAERIIYEALA